MTETIKPPSKNSLLAKLFEFIAQMLEKSVIMFEEISSSQADAESVVRAALSRSPFDAPEEKCWWREMRGEGPIEDVCETEAGAKADVEDEDVDVIGGIDEVGVSRYNSEVFTPQRSFVKKDLRRKCVRERR